ncbi:MAG TPA: hypothetical protein VI685_08185 [Candidatus Angelobacter sp.]
MSFLSFRTRTAAVVLFVAVVSLAAMAQIEVQPPYHLRVFAHAVPGQFTQPDSIAVSKDRVFIGYGNGVAKDGTDGKSSTIVEYRMDGSIVRTFSVVGHNDGLKIDPRTHLLWALQNEDGNPALAIINPGTGTQQDFTFAPTVHGGGFDDMVFRNGEVFLSASNPSGNPNTDPAIVRAKLSGSTVVVSPVFAGNATATDLLTETPVTLNLQDPDSMITDPAGDLLLDSQADSELVIVRHPGAKNQSAVRVPVSSPFAGTQVDDTVFATSSDGFILVSDLDAGIVYAISRHSFTPGTAYSAANVPGFVGRLDLEFGQLTPIVTGLRNPRGMAFVARRDDDDRESRDDREGRCEADR